MKLRHDRPAWVAERREQARQQAQSRPGGRPRGRSEGVISFGSVGMWQQQKAARQAQALARPLPARIAADPFCSDLVAVSVLCPYCDRRHSYVFDAAMIADCLMEPLDAGCGQGSYRVQL